MELVALGQIESITAHHGQVLQLRPKAANGQALTTAIGRQGQLIQTRPRGFYLRATLRSNCSIRRSTRSVLDRVGYFSPVSVVGLGTLVIFCFMILMGGQEVLPARYWIQPFEEITCQSRKNFSRPSPKCR